MSGAPEASAAISRGRRPEGADFFDFPALALTAMAAAYVGTYVHVAVARMQYPFVLEWVESHSLQILQRLAEGKPLYVAPTIDYIPPIYPPLYFLVAGALAPITGVGFVTLRLVSFVSSLGCLWMIWSAVASDRRSTIGASVACGLFAAAYPLSASWFDVGRVDTAMLFAVLAAIHLSSPGRSRRSVALGTCAACVSLFTKQSALLACVTCFCAVAMRDRRAALKMAVASAIVVGVGVLCAHVLYGGWFERFVIEHPSRHGFEIHDALRMWRKRFLRPLFVAAAIGALWTLCRASRRPLWVHHAVCAGGLLAASWFGSVKLGAGRNALLPAYAAMAILAGLAVDDVHRRRGTRRFVWMATAAAVALQLWILRYDPQRWIPTPEDLRAGTMLVERIAAVDGDVFVPAQDYLARMAGKRGHAHSTAIGESIGSYDRDRTATAFAPAIIKAIRSQFGAAIVEHGFDRDRRLLGRRFRYAGSLIEDPKVFRPVAGGRGRPDALFVRARSAPRSSTTTPQDGGPR
jgi:hypothetical protein